MATINKTQLDIEKAEERGIVHRDYIAHCLRWTHILKYAKIGQSWCDIGCGNFMLAKVLYSNKYKPFIYVGIDVRESLQNVIPKTNFDIKFIPGNFVEMDLSILKNYNFDNIVAFEILEHNTKENGIKLLENIKKISSTNTNIFLSTPNYNKKDKARNHIYEWEFNELKEELLKHFTIISVYGTFASQADIYPVLSPSEKELFTSLKKYYDSNLLSIIFAPNYPEHSRNCLWYLKIK